MENKKCSSTETRDNGTKTEVEPPIQRRNSIASQLSIEEIVSECLCCCNMNR